MFDHFSTLCMKWLRNHKEAFIVCAPPPPPFAGGGEGRLNLQPSFQKGGLDRTSTFREGNFFTGGCNFKKRKSEIFNGKKSL